MKERIWIAVGALAVAVFTTLPAAARQCENPRASRDDLAASFRCNMDLRDAERAPILLLPGTTLKPEENFGWNYIPALDAMGWPVCAVEMPENALANIQLSAEHVEYAIREAYRLSGHKVQIIGFSQGGMAPRWPLRFSPDTRQKVEELISLSGSHNGSMLADLLCGPLATPDPNGVVGCEAAIWQQGVNSEFITTLNQDYETVPEVDYTAAYTLFDDVLFSNGGPEPTSALAEEGDNVVNITLQDVCPDNTANHTAIGTFDPVGYAIVLDALENEGPASLDRLLQGGAPGSNPVCFETLMPGVDPVTFDDDLMMTDETILVRLDEGTHLTQEPLPACYTAGNGPQRGSQ